MLQLKAHLNKAQLLPLNESSHQHLNSQSHRQLTDRPPKKDGVAYNDAANKNFSLFYQRNGINAANTMDQR